MAAYSMDLRLRVLRDADAGLPRPRILHAQLTELAALIRERPDRTLAELQEALRTPASLPTLCRTIKRLGVRLKKNGTRVGTRSR